MVAAAARFWQIFIYSIHGHSESRQSRIRSGLAHVWFGDITLLFSLQTARARLRVIERESSDREPWNTLKISHPNPCRHIAASSDPSQLSIKRSPEFDASADTNKVPFTEKQMECKRTSICQILSIGQCLTLLEIVFNTLQMSWSWNISRRFLLLDYVRLKVLNWHLLRGFERWQVSESNQSTRLDSLGVVSHIASTNHRNHVECCVELKICRGHWDPWSSSNQQPTIYLIYIYIYI